MLAVKVLSDKEFDELPYPEAKVSLGLADTKSGQAYVRYTASNDLNKYLVEHELEHLLGEDRDEIHHGGDGVYYKGLGNIFQGLGQAVGGAGKSIFGAFDSVGKGISGLFGGSGQTKPLQVQPQGMAPNAGRGGPMTTIPSGGPQMMGFAPPEPRTSPSVAPIPLANPMSFFQGFGQSTSKPQAGSSPSVSLPSAPKPKMPAQASTSNFSLPMPSNAPIGSQTIRSASGAPMSSLSPSRLPGFTPPPMGPNVIPTSRPGIPQAPASTPSAGTATQQNVNSGFDAGKLAIGAGLEGIGQFGIQTPNMPDLSELPSVQALRNFNFNSISELDPALEQAINNDFQRIEEREYQAFLARYKSLRPGADIESDSNFKRDLLELQRMQGQRRADALAKYRFDMISQNLQLSQAELAQLQNVANLDIEMIMGQMGLDYADAQKFKDTFSRLGDTLISQGLGIGQGQEEEAVNA